MKYADKQTRHFDDEKIKAGQCVIGLQVSCDQLNTNVSSIRALIYSIYIELLEFTLMLAIESIANANQSCLKSMCMQVSCFQSFFLLFKCFSSQTVQTTSIPPALQIGKILIVLSLLSSDGNKQVCEPGWHDCLRNQKTSLWPKDTHWQTFRPDHHQPTDGHQQRSQPGKSQLSS